MKTHKPLRIVFFGTPWFAAEVLDFLLKEAAASAHDFTLVAVVTQPDRPQGRSAQHVPSDVKKRALLLAPRLPILQPEKISDPHCVAELALFGADMFVVVAFGQILSQQVLDIPRYGCINVHASLLPRYRGAAPMQRALMDGVTSTGVTIMKMVRQMDAGAMLATAVLPVSSDCTFGELAETLCRLSQPLLLAVLRAYTVGVPSAVPQDETQVTYAPKIGTGEAKIDWHRSSVSIHNLIRALSPEPGAWCRFMQKGEQKRLKIFLSRTTFLTHETTPGSLFEAEGGELFVQCGEGSIQLLEVQQEGKKKILFSEWYRGISSISDTVSLI